MKKTTFFRLILALCCFACLGVYSTVQAQFPIQQAKNPKVGGIQNTPLRLESQGFTFTRSPLEYPYDFKNPVYSDILCDQIEQQGTGCTKNLGNEPAERYQISVFGPRMTVSNLVIKSTFDYHLGADIINKTKTITDNNLPDIKCMCDGEVVQIQEITNTSTQSGRRIAKSCSGTLSTTTIGNVETTGEGQYVTVKCNTSYEGYGADNWGNIYLAYRHLSAINNSLTVGSVVSKGSTIGKMGNTGETTVNHLHLSAQRRSCPSGQYYNVHPMRLFNPEKNPHIARTLDNSEIEIYFLNINTWKTDNFLLFRFAVPYYQANLEYISIKSGSIERVFDFEQRSYETDSNPTERDNNAFDNMELFVFPFNRNESASSFYERYKGALPADHSGKKYAIPSTGVFAKSAYVLDIKTNLGRQSNVTTNGLNFSVFDIWGKGVRATLSPDKL